MAKGPSSFQKAIARIEKRAATRSGSAPYAMVGGRYELRRKLGEGAFGLVYEAFDTQDSRRVAVKLLRDADVEDQRLRMVREAHALRRLAGTCAVGLYELAETEDGRLYLVMEYLEGEDLESFAEAFERRGNLVSLRDVGLLLRPVVDTLDVAHRMGTIHRDLKPENIFVHHDQGIRSTRLLDFGLVKDMSLERMTALGSITGSPLYIAPEAWSGASEDLDPRVDVYALGTIVFRLLTGRTPFHDCTDLGSLIAASRSALRPSPRPFRAGLHPSIDAWTHRALAVEPDARFASVRELWDSLGHVLAYSEDTPVAVSMRPSETAGPTRPAPASAPPDDLPD